MQLNSVGMVKLGWITALPRKIKDPQPLVWDVQPSDTGPTPNCSDPLL